MPSTSLGETRRQVIANPCAAKAISCHAIGRNRPRVPAGPSESLGAVDSQRLQVRAQQNQNPAQQNPSLVQQNPNPSQRNPNRSSFHESWLLNRLSPISARLCGVMTFAQAVHSVRNPPLERSMIRFSEV